MFGNQAAKNILIIGPPGSGKGTLSTFLAHTYHFYHLATGDIIRDHIKRKTALGEQSAAYVQKAELVPDQIVFMMVREVLAKHQDQVIIWDGFPRTVVQASELDLIMVDLKQTIDQVVYLELDEETLISRVAGRLICPWCHRVYHVVTMPPQVNNVCDGCKARLTSRSDDDPIKFKKRLASYKTRAHTLIDYYEHQNLLTRLKCQRSVVAMCKTLALSLHLPPPVSEYDSDSHPVRS